MARNLRLITFRIGRETFAADIMAVRQVVMYEGSTAVPAAPPFVEGIIVVRGEIVPVIDLLLRFFPQEERGTEQPLVMIAASKSGAIGLKVDEVRTVVNVSTDDLLAAPDAVRGVQSEYLVAVVQVREELLLVLDLEAILSDDEQRTLSETSLNV